MSSGVFDYRMNINSIFFYFILLKGLEVGPLFCCLSFFRILLNITDMYIICIKTIQKRNNIIIKQTKIKMLLMSSKLKNGYLQYQVHKQGLILLRKFKNKRLRIIFNISTNDKNENNSNNQSLSLEQVEAFNNLFIGAGTRQDVSGQGNGGGESSNICEVSISSIYKQLSDDRIVIFLNSFLSVKVPPYLLVLGYLVASVFFYHNHQKLSEKSQLTEMLASLKGLLEGTRVDRLQEQIKYKSGCCKKPYFMCLFQEKKQQSQQQNNNPIQQNDNNNEISFDDVMGVSYHDQFRQFYKYKQGSKQKINLSIDTLIDYFPQRSAIKIGNFLSSIPKISEQPIKKLRKLGNQFISKILGRQIFNFQITGSSLQNLCFQLCQIFNSQVHSLDLQKIYTKIITTQKIQVSDQSIEKYVNLANQLGKKIPLEMSQLIESHAKIQRYVVEESIADGCNCMLFNEYLPVYANLRSQINKKYKNLIDSNKELLQSRALTCYQEIQQDQQLCQSILKINDCNCSTLLLAIQQKIQIFIQQTINQFSTKDFLKRLINNLLEQYRESLQAYLGQNKQKQQQWNRKITQLQSQNRTYQAKCKHLQNEYMYLSEINCQFKQKLLGSSTKIGTGLSNGINGNQFVTSVGLSEAVDSVLVHELRKKVMELQIQLNQKDQTIKYLSEILDKFDANFNHKMLKPKFSQSVKNLLMEVSHKINDIYVLFGQLKKTEAFYIKIQSQFNERKQQLLKKMEMDQKKQVQTFQKLSLVIQQKKCLQQIIHESRQTISKMQDVQKEYRDCVDNLQNVCSQLKCKLADMEGDFEKYKKAMELVSAYCVNGKVDSLRNFYKVTCDEQLKELLKPIVKK